MDDLKELLTELRALCLDPATFSMLSSMEIKLIFDRVEEALDREREQSRGMKALLQVRLEELRKYTMEDELPWNNEEEISL